MSGEPGSPVCVENIGPRQRRRRLTGGVVVACLGIGLAALTGGTGNWWRPALLFLFFWAGALGIFQALDRT